MKARALAAIVLALCLTRLLPIWTSVAAAFSLVNSDAVFLYNGATSNAVNHTASNLLVAVLTGQRAGGPDTVTGITNTAADTWVQAASARCTSADAWSDIWYVSSTNGNASDVVTPTISNSLAQGSLIILQYSGQAGSTPFEVASSGATASGTVVTSGSFAPAASGNLNIAGAIPYGQSGAWTAGSGYTLRKNEGTADGEVEDNQAAAAGSQTASITNANTQRMCLSVASFKVAGGGGGGLGPSLGLLGVGR